jgi:hypothetical protein
MKPTLLFLIAIILSSCSEKKPISAETASNGLRISVIDRDQATIFVARHRLNSIGEVELPFNLDSGVILHYVLDSEKITVVDITGVWYQITKDEIKNVGKKWMEPLPEGSIVKISKTEKGSFLGEKMDFVDLSEVYSYKESP